MKKVLMITAHFTQVYFTRRELVERLLQDGYEVSLSMPADKRNAYFSNLGCKIVDTPISRRGTNPLADLKLLRFYCKLMKEVKPDVVLTYTIKPNIYGGLASRIFKTPCLVNITGLGTAIENRSFLRTLTLRLYKVGLKSAACVFFQNKSNQELFMEKSIVYGTNRLIPGSGINLDEYHLEDYPTEESGIHFLFVGRIMRDKGINELCDAMRVVHTHFPDATLEIVGGFDEDHEALLNSTSRKGIATYHGQQNDVHQFYRGCHCTVLPSYHEGTSNVLLESAATGRPVIATKVPGCIETFDEGVSGLGCNKKDAVDLAEKMITFIKLPWEQKRNMGLAGRKKMEREFNRQIVIDAYLQEIERAVGANKD